MPAIRTEVTEIVTGLAMLGFPTLERALEVRPDWMRNVGSAEFDRIGSCLAEGRFAREFATAWSNGRRFLASPDALRGRVPDRIEWKGPHRPPGYEQLPADLRVDHVYLVSCKYGSGVLTNAGPSHLFDRRLAERRVDRTDWYLEVAPEAYQELYRACRAHLVGDGAPTGPGDVGRPVPVPAGGWPDHVAGLSGEHREVLKAVFRRRWPAEVDAVYRDFAWAVASASAARWRRGLSTPARREEMLWRLLRLEAAPYFVLGAAVDGSPLHYRTATPWDFRQRHRIRAFDVWPDAVGQPLVRWRAEVHDAERGEDRITEGHVQIRWSHGRFAGVPEAKVYLDTPHHRVAGYEPIT